MLAAVVTTSDESATLAGGALPIGRTFACFAQRSRPCLRAAAIDGETPPEGGVGR